MWRPLGLSSEDFCFFSQVQGRSHLSFLWVTCSHMTFFGQWDKRVNDMCPFWWHLRETVLTALVPAIIPSGALLLILEPRVSTQESRALTHISASVNSLHDNWVSRCCLAIEVWGGLFQQHNPDYPDCCSSLKMWKMRLRRLRNSPEIVYWIRRPHIWAW